jgi:signal transduction histidine kinase/predicted Ser/Thr protein kinase
VLTALHLSGVEVEGELGRGAYSVVYRARQGGVLRAVKIPRVKGRWTKWVYREAVALARVRHPGLPTVFEVGEADDLPYLVMELVEGETLADRLGRGPISEELTLTVAQQVASALAAVHDAGLVHRDVKPRNIVLEPGGRVRLVDFGFATPIERVGEPPVGTAGTPAYAAPEQLRAPPRVDGRTDLYALGRVLAECLTGRLSLVTPAEAALRPHPLAEVIRGLVRESPDDRYPDARALLTELDRVRQGRSPAGPAGYEAGQRPQALVGRDAELQRLTQAWANIGLATGSVVVVRGARGSGKTRLVAAYVGKVREAGCRRLLEARCREGDAPLSTLRRIFEAYLASLTRGSADDRAKGEEALRAAASGDLAPFATLIAPKLAAVLGAETIRAGAAPEGFAEGAVELLIRLARKEGPLGICVDDAQWMDPVSRDVLVRLAHRADSAPLLLLLAARSEVLLAGIEQLATLDRGRLLVVDLATLGEDQIAALIASHLGVTVVERPLVQRITALGDGTPLGALEVLGAFLDTGALRPRGGAWILDVARADRVSLPDGALAMLGRRLGDVPEATRRVLETAAILGSSFRDEILANVVKVDFGDLGFALADARRAGLVEAEEGGRHRFVHDSLRERLDGALDANLRRLLHQRVAEVLDSAEAPDFDALCAIALHYGAGQVERTPGRACDAARTAASAALDQFDNETALRFFEMAADAARQGGIFLDTSYHRSLGEARLRQGLLDDSLHSFEAALERGHDPQTRATMLGRIAWVHAIRSDPTRAWVSLEEAFTAVGVTMPVESAASAARTVAHLAGARLAKLSLRHATSLGDGRATRELLCTLHYQNGRLGLEHGKPLRLLQSAIEGLAAIEPLGPSRGLARATAFHGFVLTVLRRRVAGARELGEAQRMASRLGDPVTATFCVQLEALAACFAGDFDRALLLLHECVEVRGHWLELSELCNDATAAELIDSLRGRSSRAWTWIAHVTRRLRRSHPVAAAFPEHFMHRARAALAACGGNADDDPWLAEQLEEAADQASALRGFARVLSWGPRARFFVESGDIGPAFEALVAEFAAEGHNPRFVHPTVVEYYIAVAHGRLQQCLQSSPGPRASHVVALRDALEDLRPAARAPLYKAHLLYLEGCVAWLEGSTRKAERIFANAEALAIKETCPWVLYGIARVRAHALRDDGKPQAARDQARIAEALAREHGSEPRARWIREEFALPVPVTPARPGSRSSKSSRTGASHPARRQLTALLHVIRTPVSDLRPEQQVPAVMDDLLRVVDGEHGLLWFEPNPETFPPLLVGRTRNQQAWIAPDGWRKGLMRAVRETGEVWPLSEEVADLVEAPPVPEGVDATRVLVVPLSLHDRTVGAIYLERNAAAAAFSVEERDLLVVLSYQVPISIELARLLAEREQLQASLQHAQKMEAVGQLASGVAHDYSNMMVVVSNSLNAIQQRTKLDPKIGVDLDVISGAMDRAGHLMRQLLSFSKERPAIRTLVSVNDLLVGLASLLDRLAGEDVTFAWKLDKEIDLVNVERASLEQVLVNLVANARDAMPAGGTITVTTRNVTLDGSARRRVVVAGDYVVLEVSDTGRGISAEDLPRIFDPFFTTKPAGAGTGIGLTTAYAFVKRSDGDIDVSSEPGEGTTFHLYFPSADDMVATQPEPRSEESRSPPMSGSFPTARRFDPGSSAR